MKKLIQFSAIKGLMPLIYQCVNNAMAFTVKLHSQPFSKPQPHYYFLISANEQSMNGTYCQALFIAANAHGFRGEILAQKK